MSTTQFTELLSQAGRLDQRVGGTSSTERFKACEELVSILDKLALSQKPGRRKIAYHALYAPVHHLSSDSCGQLIQRTEKATLSRTWQRFPKAQHEKSPATSP
jgi:hypothetical protein